MKKYYTAGLTAWLILHACAAFSQQAAQGIQSDTAIAPSYNLLQQMIVSGNRTIQKRTEAPIAISVINTQTIKDTKANQLDQLLNKVTGVFMVDLGNEQHEMNIRQPMSTQSLFLYLEDGIPIRTTGIYNHNALLEMNMTATRQMEIIRGLAICPSIAVVIPLHADISARGGRGRLRDDIHGSTDGFCAI